MIDFFNFSPTEVSVQPCGAGAEKTKCGGDASTKTTHLLPAGAVERKAGFLFDQHSFYIF